MVMKKLTYSQTLDIAVAGKAIPTFLYNLPSATFVIGAAKNITDKLTINSVSLCTSINLP